MTLGKIQTLPSRLIINRQSVLNSHLPPRLRGFFEFHESNGIQGFATDFEFHETETAAVVRILGRVVLGILDRFP